MDEKELIMSAIHFAQTAHEGQKDDENLPYIFHPMQVGRLLSLVTNDPEIRAAAYLHDVVEDCGVTKTELQLKFGDRVADLVMELTHEGSKEEGHYFPRLKSRDAIIIKLADRMSNLSRMGSWDEDRKEHYLKRTKFWKAHKDEMTQAQLLRRLNELEATISRKEQEIRKLNKQIKVIDNRTLKEPRKGVKKPVDLKKVRRK